jgi:UDP-glucose 4-epimerase
MKYLIFGGLGFVGNQLVRTLKSIGEEVVIADNSFRVAEKIDDIQDVTLIHVDIRNATEVINVITNVKPDVLINLAAIHYIPECNSDPGLAFDVNVNGVINILKSLDSFKPKHLILISSGAVYADYREKLDELKSNINPVDIYGVSKKVNEDLALIYSKKNPDVTFSIVRLFNVYGPRETNAHIIPEILSQLRKSKTLTLGNLKPRRDMIYVDDVANGLLAISKRLNGSNYEIINLSSGEDISMYEMIELIGRLLNSEIEIEIDPKRFRDVDKLVQNGSVAKLKKLTGFQTEVSIEKGLKQLLYFEGFLRN